MGKKVIRLAEEDLHNIIKECAIKVLNEYTSKESTCDTQSTLLYEIRMFDTYGFPGVERITNQRKAQIKLYEGLIRSADYQFMEKKLTDIGITVLRDDIKNGTPLIYVIPPTSSIDRYHTLLQQCGWYITNHESMIDIIIPRFGNDADNLVYNKCQGKLYHTTPTANINRIMTQGLVPRSGNKIDKSQDLIHFCTTPEECISLSYSLSNMSPSHPKMFTLLKIDLSNISNNNLKPKFYYDPKYNGAVITLENIPPYCLTKISDYTITI